MAMNFEDSFFENYMGTMYPMEQEMAPDAQVASADTGVATDVGGIAEIPRNKAQEALGYVGQLLTRAGVNLDEYGLDIPVLGRVTLKDLTVGESGRILEDMSYGFMPTGKSKVEDRGIVEGPDGERRVSGLSGSAPMLQAEAIDLLGLPFIGTTAKVATKPIIGATKKIIEAGKDLPVGMSIKAVDESLDPLGFYSAASKAVDNIAQEKGTGAQFLAQIEKTPGVKKEELLWTGLDDYLKGKKSVTKAEVQEFLNANRVEVQEVQLGDLKFNTQSEYALPEVVDLLKKEQGTSYENMRLVLENDYNAYQALAKKFPNLEDTDNWSDRVLSELIDTNSGAARFEKFTLPGGENYREIYLTLPSKMNEDQIAQEMYGAPFDKLMGRARADVVNKVRENQYMVPRAHSASPEADVNRLAQIRVNDRIDADGKKVLFVEEIQSDWHQVGRKTGYAPENKVKRDAELKSIQAEREKLLDEKKKLEELADPYVAQGKDAPAEIVDKWSYVSNRINDLQSAQNKLSRALPEGVPDAPFKTSWHELALKRAIQLASEGGYDRIAFTTGKTQAERYDLSKQINTLRVERIDGGPKSGQYEVSATDKNGKPSVYTVVPENELDGIIGKDLAKKVVDDAPNYPDGKEYSGLDLQVGGEGMAGFYDTILPKYLDKYGKKWDAKTGMTAIKADGSDAPVHYMDITPKMKESVLTKGQPLFQMAPAIPAGVAAGQQEDNK
jgi:hypothetical protein